MSFSDILKNAALSAIKSAVDNIGCEDVYDEEGDYAYCYCGEPIKFINGSYECPSCGTTYTRAEFFNHIGANPPGPACVTCDNLYPGCIICPYGYIDDDF